MGDGMFLVIKSKKIPIQEVNTWRERFKSFKFVLQTIDTGLFLPHKKMLNTTFFCQRVDACFTDSDNKILYLHENIKSEKRILHLKAKNLYILPLGTCEHLKVGEALKIVKK